MSNTLTQSRLKELFHYDPDTGIFTRIGRTNSRQQLGEQMSRVGAQGYIVIYIGSTPYTAHRLAWLYVHGRFPSMMTDHRNGNRTDNRISNLREASPLENMQNIRLSKRNTSGHIGVNWYTRMKKWRARIMASRVVYELGLFDTIEEAAAAYREAKARLHTFNPDVRQH